MEKQTDTKLTMVSIRINYRLFTVFVPIARDNDGKVRVTESEIRRHLVNVPRPRGVTYSL